MSSNNNNQPGTTTQKNPCPVCPECTTKCECHYLGLFNGIYGIADFCIMLLLVFIYIRDKYKDEVVYLVIIIWHIICGSLLIYNNKNNFK